MSDDYIVLSADDGDVLARPSQRGTDGRLDPVALPVRIERLSAADAADLAGDDSVRAVAPVMPLRLLDPVAVSPGPIGGRELEAASDGGGVAWGVAAVGATAAGPTGRGVRVAVLDTGIDPDHPAFAGVELVRRNFTDEPDDDLNGHGSHCAGTIFGRPVDGFRIGVAPGVETALIGKVIGARGASTACLVEAIQWAVAKRADVISMSLGIDFALRVEQLRRKGANGITATSQALEGYRATVELFGRLMAFLDAGPDPAWGTSLVVAAAGNESDRDSVPPQLVGVAPPAAADGVLAVGAAGRSAGGYRVAPFSNTRARVVGPGVDVVSVRPGGGLTVMDGTSMATPHVVGVAALWAERLLASHGAIDSDLIRSQIVATAGYDGFAPGARQSDVGLGLVRAPR